MAVVILMMDDVRVAVTTPTAPSPEEVAPTVDCSENPDDPQCETATIPEAEDGGNDGGDNEGEDSSGGGGSNPEAGSPLQVKI